MPGVEVANIVLGSGTALSAVAAWAVIHLNRKQNDKGSRQDEMAQALHPTDVRLSAVENLVKAIPAQIEFSIDRAMDPLRTDIGVLKTQVEVFWRSVALDAAKIIHSPDPARRHVDVLLEALTEGTLTIEEDIELRKLLVVIRNWEPGHTAGFPIRDGEQGQAALLLRTMKYLPQQRDAHRA